MVFPPQWRIRAKEVCPWIYRSGTIVECAVIVMAGGRPLLEIRNQPDRNKRTALLVQSNLSITLGRLFGIFAILSAVTLAVALTLTWQGFWPVLIFALVHLWIVGWCFRFAWRNHWARQRIEIGPDTMIVEHVALKEHSRVEWPTPWVQVHVVSDRGQPRVFLARSGESLEVGGFLPPSERKELAEAIQEGLKPYSAWSDKHHS